MVQTAAVGRPTKFPYVAALDGLRGIYVLVIGLFHFSITAGWDPRRDIFPGSFFAPSAFFTLSGYLITSLLLAERERTDTIDGRGFWGRRFRRLLPASVAVIVAAAILTALFPDLWGRFPGVDAAGGLFSMSNWQAIRLAEADGAVGLRSLGPLSVFWSLGLEEQFYLGLFTIVILTGTLRHRTRALTIALVVVAALSVTTQVLMHGSLAREYFGTDTRAAEAVAGCLLALWVHHRGLPRSGAWAWIGIAATVLAFALWGYVPEDAPWVLTGGLSAFSLVTIAMIIGASVPGPLRIALSNRPLVALGRISYPVYLTHWPITLIMSPDRMGFIGWPLIAARSVVTVAVSWALFRWLETPMRTWSWARWPRGLVIWGVPAAFALVLTTWSSGWGWVT
ncbi:MAG: acyltransferase family protein [Microthrixaceae bacterium]